ncbi:MAG: 4Fe-4S binding protein [Cellulosilyticaceae bacterium]
MGKKVIQIDEEKCIGCGICANTCEQSALEIIDGKAKVVRQDACDGIGRCLPVCPVDAITFSDKIVEKTNNIKKPSMCACPGTQAKKIERNISGSKQESQINVQSELNQWPVQIKLVPPKAPYFENAKLLIAADCTAFAYANFHEKFMKNKITLIGCPKLDEGDYTDKLTEIIKENNLESVTVVRMQVPCCAGIANAVKNALQASGKMIPWQIVTLSTDGKIIE